MRIFLTVAGGYIGGTIADLLIGDGHIVQGLVRSQERAALRIGPTRSRMIGAELPRV